MENIKQEVSELHKEMTNLKASMEHLTGLVEILVAAQVNPSRREEAMIKVFTETLKSFSHEKVMVNAPNDFPDKVNVGVRLEEDVGKGCLYEDGSSANGVKKFDNNFSKKRTRGRNNHRQNHHVSPIHQQNQQVPNQRKTQFDPIPITYTELFPILMQRNLVQTRPPPKVPEKIHWYYKADLACTFHQGAPGHDLEGCFALKIEVQKLVRSGILSFKDVGFEVQIKHVPKSKHD